MSSLPLLTLTELDQLLLIARREALREWPYTFNERCNEIEAEYRRRHVSLPEDRDVLGQSSQ